MALNIQFEGYVNEVKQFGWGSVAKVSHNQRAKNDAGEWETVSKDYLDVTLPEGAIVDEGSIVRVEGTFKVSTYDKRDGSTGVAIKVRAQSVTPVERGGKPAAAKATEIPAGWEPVDTNMPF